jgi:DNA mismatch repair protein MutL
LGKVRLLPPELVAKIAAGELIERPFSVVKELVENALDAGAKKITVQLEEGGKRSIMVRDDGEGMSPEDAELALMHHATSKIQTEEDLEKILTYGFRGEALPSIASVSKLTLITKAQGYEGISLYVEGGKLLSKRTVGVPRGTSVFVKELFFNLPARRKFLKGTKTELEACIEALVRLAIPKPQVFFELSHEGKGLLLLPPASAKERVLLLFGKDLEDKLLEVNAERGSLRLEGWIGKEFYWGNTRGIYFFVNDRYVREKGVLQILNEVYSDLIPRGTYPFAILNLKIPPEEVDVNVHPTKMEVRFLEPEKVYTFIKETLKGLLGKGESVGLFESLKTENLSFQLEGNLKVIGQLKEGFLLVEAPNGLLIFDQHALNERILYERGKKKRFESNPLLFPLVVELEEEKIKRILTLKGFLEELGLQFESFGPKSLCLRSIPSFLKVEEVKEILHQIGSLQEGILEMKLEEILKLFACKGARKFNEFLPQEEILALLKEWEELGRPKTCPHGRPLLWEISERELLRYFRRPS